MSFLSEAEGMRLEKHMESEFADVRRELAGLQRSLEKLEADPMQYVSLDVYNQRHDAIDSRLAALEAWKANFMGRLLAASLAYTVIIGVTVAVLTHLLDAK